VRNLAIGVAVVIGTGMMLVAFTLGRCDAFGGRCPSDAPSIFDDDTFGIAAAGAALAFGVPVLLYGDRDRPRWMKAFVVALTVGAFVGLAARGGAYG
jgi:hypothetical protein